MPSALMNESNMDDAWIREMMANNPPQRVFNDAGQWTGNITTGPVRLTFCESLFDAKPKMKSDPKSRSGHGTACLFPPDVDLGVFMEEYANCALRDFGTQYDERSGTWPGLTMPFKDQALKTAKYSSFTPGSWWFTTFSDFKPPIVDARGNPIVDKSKVYPGIWAIVAVNVFPSDKGRKFPNHGPAFGLQTIMIIADDKRLGAGAPDPRQTFGGVKVKPPAGALPTSFAARAPQGPGAAGSGVTAFYPANPSPTGAPRHAPRPAPAAYPQSQEDDLSAFM